MSDSTTETRTQSTEISVTKSPTGWRASLSGMEAYQIAVALIIVGCTAVMIWQVQQSTNAILLALTEYRTEALKQHALTQKMLGQILANQAEQRKEREGMLNALDDKVDVNTYVMTLPQKDRESLKLQMPEALRRMLINQRVR